MNKHNLDFRIGYAFKTWKPVTEADTRALRITVRPLSLLARLAYLVALAVIFLPLLGGA